MSISFLGLFDTYLQEICGKQTGHIRRGKEQREMRLLSLVQILLSLLKCTIPSIINNLSFSITLWVFWGHALYFSLGDSLEVTRLLTPYPAYRRKYLLTNYKLIVYFLYGSELMTEKQISCTIKVLVSSSFKKICSASHFWYAYGWQRYYFLKWPWLQMTGPQKAWNSSQVSHCSPHTASQ